MRRVWVADALDHDAVAGFKPLSTSHSFSTRWLATICRGSALSSAVTT
jgi:hypothetical protein